MQGSNQHLGSTRTVLAARGRSRRCGIPPSGRSRVAVYVDATFGRGGHSRLLLSQARRPMPRLLAHGPRPGGCGPRHRTARQAITDAALSHRARGLSRRMGGGGVESPGPGAPVERPADGHRRVVAADRQPRARLQLPLRCAAGHAHGHHLRARARPTFIARASVDELTHVIRTHMAKNGLLGPIAKALDGSPRGRTACAHHGRAVPRSWLVRSRRVKPGQNPATRTFQALRIHTSTANSTNFEAALESAALKHAGAWSGRLSVISFHSLEDRIVKTFIAQATASDEVDRRAPFARAANRSCCTRWAASSRPRPRKSAANPRARSAVLRGGRAHRRGHGRPSCAGR